MREILFRGKRVDNGEWISGSILSFDDGGKVILSSTAKVFKEHGTTTICCNECYDVYPETVGQYTGLTDKNGVKIFEGDIFEADESKFVIKFGECGGVQNVEHKVGYIGFYVEPIGRDADKLLKSGIRTDILYWVNAYKVEVIGNIHDNPELLEGSNK